MAWRISTAGGLVLSRFPPDGAGILTALSHGEALACLPLRALHE